MSGIALSIVEGLICALGFAAFTIYMLLTAGGEVHGYSVIGIFSVGFLIWMTGDVVRRIFRLECLPVGAPLAFVLGTAVVSIVAVTALLIGTQSLIVVAIFGGVALVVYLYLLRVRLRQKITLGDRTTRDGIIGILVPIVLFGIVAFWSADLPRVLPVLKSTFRLNAWTDYYIHATEVAQLGSVFSAGRGSVLLAGESIPLYHYAYLGVASILAGFVDIPPLGLVTAFLAPFGIFTMACGVYTYAAVRSSPTIGMLCTIFVLFLPDASAYGFKNGFWGFHWLLVTAPGTGYAVGVALAGFALIHVAYRRADRRLLFLALGVVGASMFFRIQIFLLSFPAALAALAYEKESLRAYRRPAVLTAVGLIAISILVLVAVPAAREQWLKVVPVAEFVRAVHLNQAPTGYSDMAAWVTSHTPPAVSLASGVLFTPVVALGCLILLYPAAYFLNSNRASRERLRTFPVFLFLTFVAMIVVTPGAPSGDTGEFKHRSFPFLYAVFLVWTVVDAGEWCSALLPRRGAWIRVTATALLVGAFAARVIFYSAPWVPRFQWAKDFYGTSAERDLVAAAFFMRAHRGTSDVVALIPTQPHLALSDRGTIFASLADVPVFLARYPIQKLGGGRHTEVADERMKLLNGVDLGLRDCESLQTLQREGVTWLVTYDLPRASGAPEAFRADRAAVYEVAPAAEAACHAH